jgi:hypothetical protein
MSRMSMKSMFASLFAVSSLSMAAQTPINTVPFTIKEPGSYYLTTNLAMPTKGAAITVATSNVTIDLSGFTLTAADIGIKSTGTSNLFVKNGSIRTSLSGWSWGYLGHFQDYSVTLTNLSITASGIGVLLHGRNNTLTNTGILAERAIWLSANSSFISNVNAQSNTTGSNAIDIGGSENVIEHCQFTDFAYTHFMYSTATRPSVFRDNTFQNVLSIGLQSTATAATDPIFVNNVFVGSNNPASTTYKGTGNLFY